jgi:hypothetical protein
VTLSCVAITALTVTNMVFEVHMSATAKINEAKAHSFLNRDQFCSCGQ